MLSTFEQMILSASSLSTQEVSDLWNMGKPVNFAKGSFLSSPGSSIGYTYYIHSGIYMHYTKPIQSSIQVDYFTTGPDFMAASFPAVFFEKPSPIFCEAMTDIVGIQFNKDDLIKYADDNDGVHKLLFTRFLIEYRRRELKEISEITLSAKKRYQHFRNTFPALEEIIPLKFIASYINVHPASLSRIRNSSP